MVTDDLRDALATALEACRQAIGDYQAGLLDDDQLRHELFRAGVVTLEDELWLRDLHGAQWWRYDGRGLEAQPAPVSGAAAPRLRQVVDALARDLATPMGGQT